MSKLITLSRLKSAFAPLMALIDKKAESPSWSENDPTSKSYIADRPFYTTSTSVTIFPEQVINNNEAGNTVNEPLIVGQTYTVTFNGKDYTCICRDYDGYRMLGNNAIYEYDNGITADTGEPFACETEGNSCNLWFYLSDQIDTAPTVKITTIDSKIVKIPEKYLPESLGTFCVAFTRQNDEGLYNCDKSVIEIEKAFQKGNSVIAIVEGYYAEFYLTSVTTSNGSLAVFQTIPEENGCGYYIRLWGNGSVESPKDFGPTLPHTDYLDNGKILGIVDGKYALTTPMVVDETLSNTSTNPVQNKVVVEAINASKDNIALTDQVNGYIYLVSIRDGNLVSTIGVKSIAVTTMPVTTEYMHGAYFDSTGMVVTATCYDGTTKEITNYTCPINCLTEVTNFVEIVYIEAGIRHITTVPVTVTPFDPAIVLVDFNYIDNGNGTYTITDWKGTYNGASSTEMIIPNYECIIV